jgi:leader peptidase (prepilin peptidase) / N-methyltransferase
MLAFQGLNAALAAVVGLLVGSFLNVLIYRLPKMMERQWAQECAEFAEQRNADQATGQASSASSAAKLVEVETPFNLFTPRSRCGSCGHAIRWFENVPVVSYAFLRGKCASCKATISMRYPLVEIATAALFAFCVWTWGVTPVAAAWCIDQFGAD